MILENETLEDLGLGDYKIIQKKDGFKFGIDAVLLANFVSPKRNEKGVDLGSGTGIIPTIIAAKSSVSRIIGIEIQEEMTKMANRSAQINELQERIHFVCADIKKISDCLPKHQFDFVTSNPPYYKTDTITSPNAMKNISRHELLVELSDIFVAANYLLKPQKSLYLIHKPERLVELIELARAQNLEPKEIQFIYPSSDKAANLILLKYVKNGRSGLKYRAPLFVYNNGRYSDEIQAIYTKKSLE